VSLVEDHDAVLQVNVERVVLAGLEQVIVRQEEQIAVVLSPPRVEVRAEVSESALALQFFDVEYFLFKELVGFLVEGLEVNAFVSQVLPFHRFDTARNQSRALQVGELLFDAVLVSAAKDGSNWQVGRLLELLNHLLELRMSPRAVDDAKGVDLLARYLLLPLLCEPAQAAAQKAKRLPGARGRLQQGVAARV